MAWTKNFTLPTNFNNNNQFDTSSVLTPDMFNVPYQNTLYLKDHLDIVEGKLSNIDDSLYNLGAYDTITANSDGSYTITRQTGYLIIKAEDIKDGTSTTLNGNGAYTLLVNKYTNAISDDSYWDKEIGISNNGYPVKNLTRYYCRPETIGITNDNQNFTIGFSAVKTQTEIQAMCPIYIQYKLATATTEKVEANHYSAYNQDFILEHNKSEAERSANLTPYNLTSFPLNSSQRHLIAENLPSGTYTLSLNLNAYTSGSDYIVYINDNSIGTYSNGTSATFTSNNYINSIKIYSNDAEATSAKVMLNEGSIALPYQEYEGKIAHLKDLELYGTKPAIANVQCPIDLSKWNDNTQYYSSGSSVPNLRFDNKSLGNIYLLPTSSSGSMTKGIVRYTGGDTDAFTWSISAITSNYIELSCATKFFLDGPASSSGTLKTANYVLEIEDMYGHTFSLPFSVNYRK